MSQPYHYVKTHTNVDHCASDLLPATKKYLFINFNSTGLHYLQSKCSICWNCNNAISFIIFGGIVKNYTLECVQSMEFNQNI